MKAEAKRPGWSEPKWLFPTQQNTPIDYSRMADEHRATLKAAGLTGFTPYSMRHTFAALRLQGQENPTKRSDEPPA